MGRPARAQDPSTTRGLRASDRGKSNDGGVWTEGRQSHVHHWRSLCSLFTAVTRCLGYAELLDQHVKVTMHAVGLRNISGCVPEACTSWPTRTIQARVPPRTCQGIFSAALGSLASYSSKNVSRHSHAWDQVEPSRRSCTSATGLGRNDLAYGCAEIFDERNRHEVREFPSTNMLESGDHLELDERARMRQAVVTRSIQIADKGTWGILTIEALVYRYLWSIRRAPQSSASRYA